MERGEWHNQQTARIARVASEMGRLFNPNHNAEQSASYDTRAQELHWLQHEKAEHDKFKPPYYSDHRFC